MNLTPPYLSSISRSVVRGCRGHGEIRTVKIRTLTTRAQNVRRLRTVTEIVIAYLSTVRKFEFLRYGNPEIEQEAQLLPRARMTA